MIGKCDKMNAQMWRCDCTCNTYLVIEDLYPEDDDSGWISISGQTFLPSIWDRVKGAWLLLWRGYIADAEMLLRDKELAEVREWLAELAERRKKAKE